MYTLTWVSGQSGSLEIFGNMKTIQTIYSYLIKDKTVCAIHAYYRGSEVNPERGLVSIELLKWEDKHNYKEN